MRFLSLGNSSNLHSNLSFCLSSVLSSFSVVPCDIGTLTYTSSATGFPDLQPRNLWRLLHPRPLVFQGTQPRSLWSLQQMVSPRCFLRVHLGGESVTTLLPENGTGSSLKASRAGASDHSPDESSVVWGVHGEGSPGRGRSASPCHLTLLSVNATELEGDKDFHRVWFSFLWGQPCVQRKGKWRLGLLLVRFPTVPHLTYFQSFSGEEFVGTEWL